MPIPSGFSTTWATDNTSLVPINAAGLATRITANNVAATIKASINKNGCFVNAPDYPIWLGKPYFTQTIQGPSQLTVDYSGRYTITAPMGSPNPSSWSVTPDWYIYTSSSISATIVAKSTGLKYLTVTNTNICGTDMARKTITGVKAGTCSGSLAVYPNPSPGDVTINIIPPPGGCNVVTPQTESMSLSANQQNSVILLNSGGEKVFETTFDGTTFHLKQLGLKQGAYILKVITKEKNFEERLLIE